MTKYEIEFELKSNNTTTGKPSDVVNGLKSLFSLMNPETYKGRRKETVTAFTESQARQQIESKYYGKTVIIYSCKIIS